MRLCFQSVVKQTAGSGHYRIVPVQVLHRPDRRAVVSGRVNSAALKLQEKAHFPFTDIQTDVYCADGPTLVWAKSIAAVNED